MNKYISKDYRDEISIENLLNKVVDVFKHESNAAWNCKCQNNDFEVFVSHLTNLKFLEVNYYHINKVCKKENLLLVSGLDKKIDEILTKKQEEKGFQFLAKIRVLLEKSTYGMQIIQESASYKAFQHSIFKEKTEKQDINYVLKYIKGKESYIDKPIDTEYLREQYQTFIYEYNQLVKSNLSPDEKKRTKNIESLATSLIQMKIVKEKQLQTWTGNFKKNLTKIIAKVFAILTLQNSQFYFEAYDLKNNESFLLQPHCAQIIAIFRMLGMGTFQDGNLVNNLVQIGTGEGKSMVLAGIACVFAVLGFDVYCACYSQFLSERDSLQFSPLFEALQVKPQIHYGTFNQLCESIIKKEFDIREVIKQIIFNRQQSSYQIKDSKPQVLLIDEVDVFFGQEFFGETYSPISLIQTPETSNLLDFIWKNKNNDYKITVQKVMVSEEYKALVGSFNEEWKFLAHEAVKDMVTDLQQFMDHQYVVKDGKIGYKNQDNLVFNQSYGYKTTFAYYYEFENQKIAKQTLDQQKYIAVKCGNFSYAEIPLLYTYIVGVTGTLDTLTSKQLQTIYNSYKIRVQTYMPSVFGQTRLNFDPSQDFFICDQDSYYSKIVQEIQSKNNAGRPILVFFEDEQKLRDFLEQQSFDLYRDEVKKYNRILTEELSITEKEERIKSATQLGAITLLTKSFGRGTDFIIRDPQIKDIRGAHVLQTYWSDDYSEEVQIRGRTARQGDEGSYSIIISDDIYDKYSFDINSLSEEGRKITYEILKRKREELFNQMVETTLAKVNEAKNGHEMATELLRVIKVKEFEKAIKILAKLNVGTEINDKILRTMIVMDATYSMDLLFKKSKGTVEKMFYRTEEVLDENGITQKCFEVQQVVYRNYSSSIDGILQYSPWTSKASDLKQFLKSIKTSGGQGNEAIEVALWHALQQHLNQKISQIILIGDAPPNTRADIESKRKGVIGSLIGFDNWSKTVYGNVRHYKEELNDLIAHKIPVHAFYVHTAARESFQGIADKSGGQCSFLDINSSNGAEQLTNLVTSEILRNIGQSQGKGDELVNQNPIWLKQTNFGNYRINIYIQ